ncbi:MAG: hypothetical protein AAGI90_04395 [Chlamydiota bacterium]
MSSFKDLLSFFILMFFCCISPVFGSNIASDRGDSLQTDVLLNRKKHLYYRGKQQKQQNPCALRNWTRDTLVPTNHPSSSPSKTCVLIIVPTEYKDDYVHNRWFLGKRTWDQYMNLREDVDCYFMVCTHPKPGTNEQVWIEGNTLYVGDAHFTKTGYDRILHKTIKAMEYFQGQYTHFIRTNVNTFINVHAAAHFAKTHTKSFYSTPIWQNEWYTIGYAIAYTADVAEHIVSEYNRLETAGNECISPDHADDVVMTSLATGIYPFSHDNPFRCCKALTLGCRQLLCHQSLNTKRFSRYGVLLSPVQSLEEALSDFDRASEEAMLFRIKEGLNLEELKYLYEHMLQKIYPELQAVL